MKKLFRTLLAVSASFCITALLFFASAADVVVYENNFDSASDLNRTIPVVSAGVGSANSSVPWHWGTSAAFSLATPAGLSSQMMKITPAAGASQASMAYINAVIDKPGLYTFDFDYYCPTSTYTDGRVLRFGFGDKATEKYFTKGALTHVSYSYTLPEGSTISSVFVMMRYGSGYTTNDVFYVDNLRLLYKAPKEPLATDPTLGEVIVSEDFEGVPDGKVIFNSTSYGGTLVPYTNSYVATKNLSSTFADKSFCFTRGGSLNTSYVSSYAGNMAVRVDQPNNGSSTTPHFGLNGGNSNEVAGFDIAKPGTYTIKADFIIPSACVSKIRQVYYQIFVGDDVVTYSVPLDTSRSGDQTYTLQKSVTLDGTNDLGYVRFIAQASSADANAYFFVDNVQLYYMGNLASVNVGEKTVKSVYFAAGSTVTLPYAHELYECVDAFHEINGFTVRETGSTYPCGASVMTSAGQTSLTFDAVVEPVTFTVVCDLGNAPGLVAEQHIRDGEKLTLPASPNSFTLKGWRVPWSDALLLPGASVTFDAETMGKYAVHGRRVELAAVWQNAVVPLTPSLPDMEPSASPVSLTEAVSFASAVYEAYYGQTIDAETLILRAGIDVSSPSRDATYADVASLIAVTTPYSARRPLSLKITNENAAVEALMRAGILPSDTVYDASVTVADIIPVFEKLLIKAKRTISADDKNTVFIVGDSLCAGTGVNTHTGWPRKLDNYLDGNLRVVNIAVGGYNTTSYYKENPEPYFDMLKQIGFGDYLFIAFGTNDSTKWNDGSMTRDESRDAFYRMAREAMLEGGTPILICPVGRNQTQDGVYVESDPDIITCMNAVNTKYGLALPIVNFKTLSLVRLAAMTETERNAVYYDKWVHYSDYGADYVCGLFEELLGMSEDTNLFMLRDHFTFTHIAEKMPAVAPGVNALTGSTGAWTFEDAMNSIPVTVTDAAVASNPHADSVNGSSSVMRFPLDAWKAWVYAFKEPLENDRPVYVGFDYYKTADDPSAVLVNLYICKNGTAYIAANLSSFTAGGTWRHYGGFPTFDGAYNAGDPGVKNTDPLISVNLQHGGAAGSGHTYAYYDNITVIPAYKLTYMANDGTDAEVAHTYFLTDADGKLMTAFSPDLTVTPTAEYFGHIFRGWSLSKDVGMPDAPAAISLNHRDITLYAVWEKDADTPDAAEIVYDFETAASRTFTGGSYQDGCLVTNGSVTQTGIDTDARALRYAVIRLRSDASSVTLSFTTKTDTSFDGKKSFTVSNPDGAGFRTLVIETNPTSCPSWSGIIKDIRLTVGAGAEIEDITLCTDYTPEEYDGSKAAVYASSESIQADGGSVTLTPYYRDADGNVTRAASYETDSLAASLMKKADGSAELIGKMNGTVTVTAHFAGTDKTASVTVDVSGQADRLPSDSFKVICFGNSIRSHSPNASLGWEGSWGMAASAPEKDYAHRFIYYLNRKFGTGAATLYEGYWMAGIEGVWKQYENDPTHDFTSDMTGHIAAVEAVRPDIITIQCGENAGMSNAASYANALTQFVNACKAVCPDAVIVLCTPFWGGDGMINGVYAASSATGAPVARLHTLDTAENKATGLFDNGGVANHPGDTGMDNIARLLFAETNIVLTEASRTVYTVRPSSVTITADADTVTTDGGRLTLHASVLPSDASQTVTWSVDDTSVAVIDENGVLTAMDNGTVTVTAAAKQDESVRGVYTVTVSGQTPPFTLSFMSEYPKAKLPSPTAAKGELSPDGFVASLATYRFLGWSREKDGEILDRITMTGDTVLYARFEKAFRFDFEREGFDEGFTVENGFNRYIADGVYLMLATDTDTESGEVLTVSSPSLEIMPGAFDTLRIRMSSSAFAPSTALALTLHTPSGDTTRRMAVTATDMTDYVFDLSGISDVITGFTLIPTDTDCSVRIDEIAFENTAPFAVRDGMAYADFEDVPKDGTAVIAFFDESGRLLGTRMRRAYKGDSLAASFPSQTAAYARCFLFDAMGDMKPAAVLTAE